MSSIADHSGKVAGHIDLWRGSDYLIVNARQWQGSTGTTGSPYNFTSRSIYASKLYYDDKGQYMYASLPGGQSGLGATSVDPIYKATSTYLYAQNDLSNWRCI